MKPTILSKIFSALLLFGWIVGFVQPVTAEAFIHSQMEQQSGITFKPHIIAADRFDVSPVLKNLAPEPDRPGEIKDIPKFVRQIAGKASEGVADESIVQSSAGGPITMPAPELNFEGVNNVNSVYPPDTQGDIGPNHYIQWVNLSFQIWSIDRVNHTATSVYGPAAGNTLWQGFGGACETNNHGDPITLYDPFADRWFMSQFAIPSSPPYYQCVAVSVTPDPLGAWYRYAFIWPNNKLNDYSKFGVWPDAYYMTTNQFDSSLGYQGVGVAALDRDKMLAGQPASMIYFDLDAVNSNFFGMLPADFDGLLSDAPPIGAPALFTEWDDSTWLGDPTDMLRLWEFHVDWATPTNATFGIAGLPNATIPTANVDPDMCNYARSCIPQPDTLQGLDAISDRLMYRLQYRNYGEYQTLVSNHTVDLGGDHAGIHWFELRKSGMGAWSMYQQGVYAPDANNRWMASLALDHVGNLAVGYSVSSSTLYPSIRYAGRLAEDPLGTLSQAERILFAGTGSQTGLASRWGDYSMMAVDPTDDCTFWYTQEYIAVTGAASWRTRIGTFKFPDCPNPQAGELSVSPLALEATLELGSTSVQTMTLTNIGAADVDFELFEIDKSLQPAITGYAASHPGVQLVTIGDATLSTNPNPPTVAKNQQPIPERADSTVTITESSSQNILAGNSAACLDGYGFHTNNSYLRVFDLPTFGINDTFHIINVEVGVEEAIAGSGGLQPTTVNLYTLNGPFLWANMTLVGTANIQVSDQSLTVLSVPVNGTLIAGSTLVVEFFTPNGQASGNSFFIGSNNLGQTAPSYIAAADCGVVEPTDLASLSFPSLHIVMNVTGELSMDVPWLSTSPITGTIPGLGYPLLQPNETPFIPVIKTGESANPGLTTHSITREPFTQPTEPSNPAAVLWDQPLSLVNQTAYINQEFPDFPTYSSFLADDFMNDQRWNISTIFIPGDLWSGGTTLMNAAALHWQIYADNSGQPAGDPSGGGSPPIWNLSLSPSDSQVVLSTGSPGGYLSNTTLNLSTPIDLPAGHYWLVFYPTLSFTTDGQYGRQPADTTNSEVGHFINPGGGFGYGTNWQTWNVLGPAQQDIAFRLEGQVIHNYQQVEVTFDAGAVSMPGIYHAELKINSNSPDVIPNVPVTMTVTRPATWGNLEGVVTSLGYCDQDPQPLVDAQVVIQPSVGEPITLTTDINGYYSFWLDQALSPLIVSASAPDHSPETISGVSIAGEQTTTVNFNLHSTQPCYKVTLTPASDTKSGAPGDTIDYSLVIANTGSVSNNFTFAVSGNAWSVKAPAPVTLNAGASATVIAHVTIPSGSAIGDSDLATITASGTGGVSASSFLTTSVNKMKMYMPHITKNLHP